MSFQRIDISDAKELLKNNAVLVDIRDSESYNAGHVSGAIHLTQDTIAAFIQNTKNETPILVMCYHGNSSQMVAQYLSGQGFTAVYSVDGGYEAWS